jgi:hypothetical protein
MYIYTIPFDASEGMHGEWDGDLYGLLLSCPLYVRTQTTDHADLDFF